jgi:hypothetical protein
VFKKVFLQLRTKILSKKRNAAISQENELALREEMRIVQEQRKRTRRNFGNAGGLNSPTDFNRGFGGRAVDDHLNRSPKDNP